ncbi:uncharacterized protein LOC122947297 [Acropora millepora]|uniref:uncharacterized protein LOC122947297 n=1 Tax=Acropora millepora TaxID=45264 RepID=UPI001CF41F91|nr:uncharacterized protein LOC122947297 [Acropora millepora]
MAAPSSKACKEMDNINRPGITLGKDDVSSCTPPDVNTACKPSSGAIPKKRSTQGQLHKADEQGQTDAGREIQVVMAKDYNQLPVRDLDTTRGERTEKIEKNCLSLSSKFPLQSLPPPEDNAITDVAKGNMEKDSGTDVSKVFNRLVSDVKSRQSNSGPKGPPSSEEVAVKHSGIVDGCEESGCPEENDEVKLMIM